MKNKKGKTSPALIVVLVALVVLVGFLFYSQYGQKIAVGDKKGDVTDCSLTGTTVWASQDKLNPSSAVTAISYSVKADGSAPATNASSYPPYTDLEYIAGGSNYIDAILTDTIPCGGKTVTSKIYATDKPTVTVFNSNGDAVTNSTTGGATNQSAISTGGSASMKIRLTGTNKQYTGDLVLVIETNSSVDSVSVGGVTAKKAKPQFYSNRVSTNPEVFMVDVAGVEGAVSKDLDLTIAMKSSQKYNGTVYGNFYSKEAFTDTDGNFKVGIENTDGTAKYEDATAFVFYIAQ